MRTDNGRLFAHLEKLLSLTALVIVLVSCPQPSSPNFDVDSSFDEIPPDPPVVRISGPNQGVEAQEAGGILYYFNVTTITFVWDETDLPVRYRLNGGSWVGPAADIGTSFVGADLAEGSYRFELQQRDNAGNWSESGSVDFIVDVTPPAPPEFPIDENFTVTSNLQPPVYWTGDSEGGAQRFVISVTGPGVDHSEVLDYSDEEGPLFAYTYVDSFVRSGVATYTVAEQDTAGNLSPVSSWEMQINTDRPVFTNLPPEATNDLDELSWSWYTTGSSGDERYEVELYRDAVDPANLIDAVEVTGLEGSYTLSSAPAEGTYLLRVRESLDNNSDWSNWNASDPVVYDVTPPDTPVLDLSGLDLRSDAAGEGYTFDTTFAPSWQSGGNGGSGRYEYTIDGTSWTETRETAATISLTVGSSYSFSVREYDAAGNVSRATAATTFTALEAGGTTVSITNPSVPTFSVNEPIGALNRADGGQHQVTVTTTASIDNYVWLVNGTEVGTGTSYTIDSTAAPVRLGFNSLTLLVEIGGVPYEAGFRFEVEEQ